MTTGLKDLFESGEYKNYLKPVRMGMRTVLLLDYPALAFALRCTIAEVREARGKLLKEFPQTQWTNTWDKDSQVSVPEVVEYLMDKDPAKFLARGFYNEYRWNYYKIGKDTKAPLKTIKAAIALLNWPLDPNHKPLTVQLTKDKIKSYNKFLPKQYQTPSSYIALLSQDNVDINLEIIYETIGAPLEL